VTCEQCQRYQNAPRTYSAPSTLSPGPAPTSPKQRLSPRSARSAKHVAALLAVREPPDPPLVTIDEGRLNNVIGKCVDQCLGFPSLYLPKPAKPEPNRDFERTPPSAVRAIFG